MHEGWTGSGASTSGLIGLHSGATKVEYGCVVTTSTIRNFNIKAIRMIVVPDNAMRLGSEDARQTGSFYFLIYMLDWIVLLEILFSLCSSGLHLSSRLFIQVIVKEIQANNFRNEDDKYHQ